MQVRSRLPLLILAAALVIVFYRLLLGDVLFWGLPSLQFYPWREYAFDLVRQGQAPLWNPYVGAGAPLFANYQSSLLYPLSWLGLVLPLAQTMSAVAVLHLFIAGWGMWRFTGELGLSSLGSGVSALAFGMTSYLMARLDTYPVIQAAAWLPWLLWAALRLLKHGRPRSAGWLALFAGLLLLAGHAQTAWYSLLLVGLFALWWALSHRPFHWRRLASIVGCLALGAGIAALQLLATAELLSQSQRSSGVDFDFAMNYSYAPARILNLIAPNVFGTPADGSYITGGAFFEDAAYVGLIPLIAALAAVIQWMVLRLRKRERSAAHQSVPFWIILVLVAFVFALGVHTPIFPFLYHSVPTFDLFQGPERWLLWAVVGLSVLAGVGATGWGRGRSLRRWTVRALFACLVVTILTLIVLIFFPSPVRAVGLLERALLELGILGVAACLLTLTQPEPGSGGHRGWSIAVWLVIAADLAWAAWGLNPTVSPSFYDADPQTGAQPRAYWTQSAEQAIKFDQFFRFDDYQTAVDRWRNVRASDLPDLNMLDRVPLLNNFDPLLIAHFSDYLDLVETSQSPALLKAAGIGVVYNESEHQSINPDAARAWLVTAVCWHSDQESLVAALSDPNWQPDQQLHMLGDGGCDPPEAVPDASKVLDLTDEGEDLTISVDAAQDSWLVLADTDYPGWSASVDGAATPIYRANLNFRAVQVSAGLHEIDFEYRPEWLLPGALVSAVSLLVALLLYRLGA